VPSLPPIETVIEITSSLKEQTGVLYDSYLRFPKILERERDAVRTANFQVVEAVTEEKTLAAATIEAAFVVMQKAVADLGGLTKYFDIPLSAPVTLKDCVQFVNDMAGLYSAELFAVKILRHQGEKLSELAASFDALYKTVKPEIEANKFLVETMLENMRESYRFWLSIQEETASGYDLSGKQKATGRNSGFKAKV
jgi:hypothetical protein